MVIVIDKNNIDQYIMEKKKALELEEEIINKRRLLIREQQKKDFIIKNDTLGTEEDIIKKICVEYEQLCTSLEAEIKAVIPNEVDFEVLTAYYKNNNIWDLDRPNRFI